MQVTVIIFLFITISYSVGPCWQFQLEKIPSSGAQWPDGTGCVSCESSFVLIGMKCLCPNGTVTSQSNGLCVPSTISWCLQGFLPSAGVEICSRCGWGYSLSNGLCICKGSATIGGDCTKIIGCIAVNGDQLGNQICISCKGNLVLVNNVCICPNGTQYNFTSKVCDLNQTASVSLTNNISNCLVVGLSGINTVCVECGWGMNVQANGSCGCNNYNIQGGCTSIRQCTYIIYVTAKSGTCIGCNNTFILFNGLCVCPQNTYYNKSQMKCMPNNNSIIYSNQSNNSINKSQFYVLVGVTSFIGLVVLILIVIFVIKINKINRQQRIYNSNNKNITQTQNSFLDIPPKDSVILNNNDTRVRRRKNNLNIKQQSNFVDQISIYDPHKEFINLA